MSQEKASALCLGWHGDFMGIYISRCLRIIHLRSVHFILCNPFLPPKAGELRRFTSIPESQRRQGISLRPHSKLGHK